MAGANKAVIVDESLSDSLFSTGFMQWRPPVAPETLGPWLFYAVQAPDFLALRDRLASGTTQVALNDGNLSKITIPIAPMAEVHRIVEAIETRFARLDAAIRALKRARANLTRFRMSVLWAAVSGRLVPPQVPEQSRSRFGPSIQPDSFYPLDLGSLPRSWHVAYLNELADEVQSGFATGDHNSDGKGIPHLRMANVTREGNLDLSRLEFVPHPKPTRIRKGEILFTNTNSFELVGKTALFDKDGEWAISNHMTRIHLRQGLEPAFFARHLHYLWMAGYFRHRCTRHVNQASFGIEALNTSVPLVVPAVTEQRQIVEAIEVRLSVIDQVSKEVRQWFDRCHRLRESILKMAYEGRLVPQDPNDEPVSALHQRIKHLCQTTPAPPRRTRKERASG
jgi:type I restriction enzyme S subunit